MIVLVTGGSGCGKSTWAERLIASMPEGQRVYIATMQVYDEESVRRVARHRAQRAHLDFATIECEQNLAAAEIPQGSVVLLEGVYCLSLLISGVARSWVLVSLCGALAAVPVLLYNGKRGLRSTGLTLLFYAAYPLHLIALALVRALRVIPPYFLG